MAGAAGPNTAETGLVFAYDTGNTITSYIGEPTTNIAYAVNNNLNSNSNWWVNGGNATFNDNDTSILKPSIPNVNTSNLYVFSSLVTGTGSNQQLGSSIITINPSTTYSFSIWYYFTGTSMQIYPYVRTAVNNDLLAYFAYNGDTNGANWPKNQWLLLKATVTTQANETGIYMSSYTGTSLGDKVYYFGYQVEQKSHCTPLVLGTRSGTQGLLPLVNNLTIDISNVSFDSNAQIVFDGTNDSLVVGNNATLKNNNTSIEFVIKYLNTPNGDIIQFGVGSGAYAQYYYRAYSGYSFWNWYPVGAGYGEIAIPNGALPLNTYHHIVMTGDDQGYVQFYINGIAQTGATRTSNTQPSNWTPADLTTGGFSWDGYSSSAIPLVKIYNRVLTPAEVTQNYQALRFRFGI